MSVDLDKLEKHYQAMTPGKWYTVDKPWLQDDLGTWIIAGSFDPHLGKPVVDAMEIMEWPAEDEGPDYSQSDADMTAIVELHNAFPELLRLARLGAAVEAIKEQYSGNEKIRGSIAVMNLLYPPLEALEQAREGRKEGES